MRHASLIGDITECGSQCTFFGGRDDGVKTWDTKEFAIQSWHIHCELAALGLTPPVLSDLLVLVDKQGVTRYGFVVGKAKVFGDGCDGDLLHHEIDGWEADEARAHIQGALHQHGYWFYDDHFGNVGIYEDRPVLVDCELGGRRTK